MPNYWATGACPTIWFKMSIYTLFWSAIEDVACQKSTPDVPPVNSTNQSPADEFEEKEGMLVIIPRVQICFH